MTDRGVGVTKGKRDAEVRRKCGVGDRGAARLVRWLVAFHPPPNLPPGRGEG